MTKGMNLRDESKIYREQLITIEDLEIFKADLLNEIKKLLKTDTTQPGRKEWLRSSEVRKMLGYHQVLFKTCE